MQDYPDSKEHFDHYLQHVVKTRVAEMQELDMEPNDIALKALSERLMKEAQQDYATQCLNVHESNIDTILRGYHQRNNQIKRDGMRLRWLACPPVIAVSGIVAVWAWTRGAIGATVLDGAIALTFLAMLVGGLIWDRPTKQTEKRTKVES